MILPWVSRELYEYALRDIKSWEGSADAWELRYDEERSRCDGLSAQLLSMKQQGFNIPEPKPEPAKEAEPDPVTQAILARAGKSHALRKHYYDFVTEQRKEGVTDDEIAHAILTGVDDDAGVPG